MPVVSMETAVFFAVSGSSRGFHGFRLTEQAGLLGFVKNCRYRQIQQSVLNFVAVATRNRSIGLFVLVAGFFPFSLIINVSFAISSPIFSPTRHTAGSVVIATAECRQ